MNSQRPADDRPRCLRSADDYLRSPTRLLLLTVASFLLLIVGCGGGGSAASDASLLDENEKYLEALGEGDATTFLKILSEDCRRLASLDEIESALEDVRNRYDAEELRYEVVDTDIDRVDENEAILTADLIDPDGDERNGEPQRWIFEDGAWHLDECEYFG